ncbi:endocytosis defective- protein [Entomophthora muscae]|uniref:Endocytosis defective- protein n=1 Tax=Entomophthora muscae TaxID=34485 RepID=A0ACC2SJ97_9FUNG|nr:endocytosis defective- protein [Entomophthora muscae]
MEISPADRQKYSSIFQSQSPQNGKISGSQAKGVFMQSGLALPQLGEIWNLCDIDKDGCMDLDEFTLALHFIFSTLNGSIRQLPSTLPPQLVPPSKSSYFPRSFPLPTKSLSPFTTHSFSLQASCFYTYF